MSDGLANCCVSHRIPSIAIAPSATLVHFALGTTAYISHFVLRVVLMMSRVACASGEQTFLHCGWVKKGGNMRVYDTYYGPPSIAAATLRQKCLPTMEQQQSSHSK